MSLSGVTGSGYSSLVAPCNSAKHTHLHKQIQREVWIILACSAPTPEIRIRQGIMDGVGEDVISIFKGGGAKPGWAPSVRAADRAQRAAVNLALSCGRGNEAITMWSPD